MELNWKKSETTEGTFEAVINVKLISDLSEVTKENSNGNKYKLCTVEMENNKQVSALIYEGNYSKTSLTKGSTYLAKAIYNKTYGNDVLIQMSHLIASQRATIEDLGFTMPMDEISEITKEAEAVK